MVDAEVGRLKENSVKLLGIQLPILRYWAAVVSFNQCATTLAMVCIIIQGAMLFFKGLISVGEIVIFVSFANMVVSKLESGNEYSVLKA